MRLPLLPTLFLIAITSPSGIAAVSHRAHPDSLGQAHLAYLPEIPSSFLATLVVRRDKPAPAPTPRPASKRDPPGQAKKSESDSGDAATSQNASQPTLSTSQSAAAPATSTIIISPIPSSSASLTPTSSSSLIATTSSALLASTTRSATPSSSTTATSTPSKSSVSTGLIVGVVIAILLVLAALTWVISMRRHLQQREWQFKYHERIFDGPEGLLGKKKQGQLRQKEEVHEMIYPTSTERKGPTAVVSEKELPAYPDEKVSEPQKAFLGREVKRKPVGGGR